MSAASSFWMPPSDVRLRFWLGWGVALGCTALPVLLVSLPPFVDLPARIVLMRAFSTVCHQIPARSPHLDGVQLAVCHRCLGIYAALPLATLAYLVLWRWDAFLYRHAGPILLLALAPAGIDWSLDVLGLWTNTPHSRIVTGALFGAVAGYYLARGFVELCRGRPATVPVEGTG
jgi:uncharacterized membrane protein